MKYIRTAMINFKSIFNIVTIIYMLLSLSVIANTVSAASVDRYQLGVFPHMSSTHVERKYAPVALALSDLLNKPVRLGTATENKRFRKRVLKGDFDIAMIPPLDIVPVVDKAGYIPLARRESKAASVIVLKESDIKDIADLQGRTLGLPAGTPVNIILQLTLEDKGFVRNKKIHYKAFNNVQACLHKLLLRKVDACGTASGAAIKMFRKKTDIQVRKVMDTQAFPHMLLVANPKMSLIERKILTRAIIGDDQSVEGQKLVKALGLKARFVRYSKKDYDVIRQFRQRWIKHAKNPL